MDIVPRSWYVAVKLITNENDKYTKYINMKNMNTVIFFQMLLAYIAAILQVNPETQRSYPFWSVQGMLLGNTIGIMLATSVFQIPRHEKYYQNESKNEKSECKKQWIYNCDVYVHYSYKIMVKNSNFDLILCS